MFVGGGGIIWLIVVELRIIGEEGYFVPASAQLTWRSRNVKAGEYPDTHLEVD